MTSNVDFDRLAEKLVGYDYAYLITVDAENRPHPVPVMPTLDGDIVHIGALGGGAAGRIWPAAATSR